MSLRSAILAPDRRKLGAFVVRVTSVATLNFINDHLCDVWIVHFQKLVLVPLEIKRGYLDI